MKLKAYVFLLFILGIVYSESYAEVYTVINNHDSGPGSFREAILKANENNGKTQGLSTGNNKGNGKGHGNQEQLMDTIFFNLPSELAINNQYEIKLDSVLPPIATDLVIDGLSQNGNVCITISGAKIPEMYGLAVGDPEDPNGFLTIEVLIEGIIFKNFRKGIDTFGRVHDTHVRNCRFEDLSFTGVDTHTHGKVWFLEIDNCHFENIDSTALMIYQAKDPYIHHSTFTNNPINAITILDSQRARVENNSINNSENGIIVGDECDRGWILNNKIDSIDGNAVTIYNSEKFYIEENKIVSNLGDGINIQNVDETFVLNNFIGTDSISSLLGNAGNGISVSGYAKNLNIEDNTIGDNDKAGLYINLTSDKSNIQVNRNFIGIDENTANLLGNTGSGIELDTAWNTSIYQNIIAYNGGYGIELNQGSENTFSENEIYTNGEKPIFIKGASDTRFENWSNNSILTPSVASVAYNGTSCTVVVKAEQTYKTIELFEGDSATLDAYKYITNSFINEENGFWRGTFNWDNSENLNFRATVTDFDGNTSEIGWSCYIVTDTLDARAGSLREALVCANYDDWINTIVFDMPDYTERIIKPFTQLPDIKHHIFMVPEVTDSITLSGLNGFDYSGLVFAGNDTIGKTNIGNLIVSKFENGISINGSNSLQFENLIVEDNFKHGIIVYSDIDSLLVNKSMIHRNDSIGISIKSREASFVEVSDNYICDNQKEGLLYETDSEYAVISDNIIYSNGSEGIRTYGGVLNLLSGNNIFGNTLAGIKIETTKVDTIIENLIGFCIDTTILKIDTLGLYVDTLGFSMDSTMTNLYGIELLSDHVRMIKNNEIGGSLNDGILIKGKNTIIEDNYIGMLRDYAILGNGGNGISGIKAANLTINRNLVGNNKGDGIYGCDSSTIIKNSIGGYETDSLVIFANHGFGMYGGLCSTISQNFISLNFDGGVVVDTTAISYIDGKRTQIIDNIIVNNSNVALTVLNAQDVLVENNRVELSTQGILLDGNVSDVEIYSNTIDSINGAAITGLNSENVNIGRNIVTNSLNEGILLRDIILANISNNQIGLDTIGNSGNGISVIGGSSSVNINENCIVACGKSGVYVNLLSDTCQMQIERNYIGIDKEKTRMLQNSGHGIHLDTAWNVYASQNIIAYNEGDGIDLNYGYGNTFTQNTIYHNGLKPISIIKPGETEWANNSILTPSIAHVKLTGNSCKVVVKSEPEYARMELFMGSRTSVNGFDFITDDFKNLGNGFWEANFDWDKPDSLYFTVTATDKDMNTSEFGQSCLIVNNTRDAGTGSLRDAIGCANYTPELSDIILDLTYSIDKVIKPLSQLPDIWSPIQLVAELSDSITISGKCSNGANGLVFAGNNSNEKSELNGLIVSDFKNGIQINGKNSIHIQNTIVKDNTENGILLTSGIDSLWVNDLHIYSNDSCGISVHHASSNYINIENNEIDNNSVSGILYQGDSSSSSISNNIIYSNTQEGIYAKDGSLERIVNNQVYGNNASGIRIHNAQIDSVSTNRIGVNANSEVMPNQNGIEVSGNKYVLVYDNEIGGNHSNGMLLSSSNTVIRNNHIGILKDFTAIANGSHGISGDAATVLTLENNYIGNNAGDGVLGCNNSVIRHNYIGGFNNDTVFANGGAGLRGSAYAAIYKNVFANNAKGGVVLDKADSKISECLFFGEQDSAIVLPPEAKIPASFGDYSSNKEQLVLRGTSVNADTVEIFFSAGKDQTAIRFVGRTKTKPDGTWEFTVPSGLNYNFSGANYFANTATDQNGRTSELSSTLQIMDNVCGMDHYLAPEDRGESYLCHGDFKRVMAKDKHYTYTWVHQYSDTQDSIYSQSRITEFYDKGLYILTVEDPLGCQVIDSLYLDVLTDAIQTNFLMSSEAGVYDKIVLVETSYPKPDSVYWELGDAEVEYIDGNPVIAFADTGIYNVILDTYLGTCSGTVTKTIHIGEESKAYVDGFVYPYSIKKASVYPVPFENELTISVELVKERDLSFSVLNGLGQILMESQASDVYMEYEHKMDVTEINPGVYYVLVSDNKGESRVIRIVK